MTRRQFERAVAEMRKLWNTPAPIPKLEPKMGSSLGQSPRWAVSREGQVAPKATGWRD